MRAFGSYQTKLPAGFLNAGDLTLVSKLAEADTANAEFAEIAVRSTTNLAAVVFSCGEFLLLLLFEYHCFLSHFKSSNHLRFNNAVKLYFSKFI